ncbi:uncharacterized protein LOC144111351 [Amblyomma americanum]
MDVARTHVLLPTRPPGSKSSKRSPLSLDLAASLKQRLAFPLDPVGKEGAVPGGHEEAAARMQVALATTLRPFAAGCLQMLLKRKATGRSQLESRWCQRHCTSEAESAWPPSSGKDLRYHCLPPKYRTQPGEDARCVTAARKQVALRAMPVAFYLATSAGLTARPPCSGADPWK